MERRDFIRGTVRWGLIAALAGVTALAARKVTLSRDCSSCPVYASCPGIDRCTENPGKGDKKV